MESEFKVRYKFLIVLLHTDDIIKKTLIFLKKLCSSCFGLINFINFSWLGYLLHYPRDTDT